MYSALFVAQVKPIYKLHLDEQLSSKNRCLETLLKEVEQRDKDDCILLRSVDSPGHNLNQLVRPQYFNFEERKQAPQQSEENGEVSVPARRRR